MAEKKTEHVVGRVASPVQQMEFFADPAAPPDRDPEVLRVLDWFDDRVAVEELGGVRRAVLRMSDLKHYLRGNEGRSQDWWRKRARRHKLKDGEDFWVCRDVSSRQKGGRGGHNRKDYWVRLAVARTIVLTDPGHKAKEIREAFWELAQKYKDCDPTLVKDIIDRADDPETVNVAFKASVRKYQRMGRDDEWIRKRLDMILPRNAITSEIAAHQASNFGEVTDGMYVGAGLKKARKIKEERGLKHYQPARDGLDFLEMGKVMFAEILATVALRSDASIRGNDAVLHACVREAVKVKDINPSTPS